MRVGVVPFGIASSGIVLSCGMLAGLGDPVTLDVSATDAAATGEHALDQVFEAGDERGVDGTAADAHSNADVFDSAADAGGRDVAADAPDGDTTPGSDEVEAGPSAPYGLVAYVRADGVSTVVYQAGDRHIRELSMVQGSWTLNDLTVLSGSELTGGSAAISAQASSKTTSSILYLNGSSQLDELSLADSGWRWDRIDTIPSGPETGWQRSDGVYSVAFCDTTTYDVQIVSLDGGAWSPDGLPADAGAPPCKGPVVGYIRADGTDAVVYISPDGDVREIARGAGGWAASDLSASAGAPIAEGFDLSPYVRGDEVSAVVYRAHADTNFHELRFQGGMWIDGDLTTTAGGPLGLAPAGVRPKGFVRPDGVSTVVFETSDGHVREMFLQGGGWWNDDLTVLSGAPPILYPGMGPYPYVRSDGVSAVVFGGASADSTIYEIRLDSGRWVATNLTAAAGY